MTRKDTSRFFTAQKNGLIGKPSLKYGRDNCDFGRGFYCGTRLELSVMFVSEFEGASLYMCDFNPAGLNIAEFKVERDWILAVSLFRESSLTIVDMRS